MVSRISTVVLLAALGAAVFAAGCGPKVTYKNQLNVVSKNNCAVDKLLWCAKDLPDHKSRILVATFVDLDDVTSTSTIGRLMGEAAATRLTQRGYTVVNMKVRANSVAITPAGEFLLSRDVQQLSQDYDARVILVGTYTRTHVAPYIRSLTREYENVDSAIDDRYPFMQREITILKDYLYVSLRLVKCEDMTVIAAYDYRIPMDEGSLSMAETASQ